MKKVNWKRIEKICFVILKHFPFKRPTVLFNSFDGQYNDNPRYVSEKLYELAPTVNQVWVITSDCHEKELPKYIKPINPCSWSYINYACRSDAVVDNNTGIRGIVRKESPTKLQFFLKSKNQINIATWHGVPFKHVGLDIPGQEENHFMNTSAEYISAGTEHSKKFFESAFYPMPIKMNGSPRNDLLINGVDNIERMKEKLGLPTGKRILLFAPTFRNSVEESGIRQMTELNIPKLLDIVSKKFGGEWIFVFRVHHVVLDAINSEDIAKKYKGMVISGNEHDDMAEYLSVTDILISDYSGCSLDYVLTKKPIFLLTLDRSHYCEDERGLYFSMDELPFTYSDSVDELYKNINEYDEAKAKNDCEKYLLKIGNHEDGKASERITNDILDFINKRRRSCCLHESENQ